MANQSEISDDDARADLRLWLRLLTCSTVVEKRLRRRFIEQFGSTLPRFDVLAALDRASNGLSMGELSRALLVSNGNVTSLVRQLEQQGLVVSRPASDRRSSIVSMTDEGSERFAELASAHGEWIRGMFSHISADEERQLFDLLGVLRRSIAAEDREEGAE
ncbi:MarR family winged helix-turn-helix transcriptional regulator [Qipengyuania algicida]|nr:MarR family transcriptional regulator [Qipengyuania algicida]